MAFPPAHVFFACGCVEMVHAVAPVPRWKAWLVAGALSVAPDLDFAAGFLTGNFSEYHGTFTHSIFALAVVTLLARLLAGWRWAAVAGVAYGSHLLVDLLDERGRTNVLLGWPFTLGQPRAIAPVFPIVPHDNDMGLRSAAESLLTPPASHQLLLQSLIGAGFLVAFLLLAGIIRRVSRSRGGRDAPGELGEHRP